MAGVSNPLTTTKRRALTNLQVAFERVCTWQGKHPRFSDLLGEPRSDGSKISQTEQRELEQFVRDLREYSRAIIRAIRSGLLGIKGVKTDPAIQAAKEWTIVRRVLGNREGLRMARSGVEKRVKRPLSQQELDFLNNVFKRLDSGEYQSWRAIQNDMTNNGLLRPMSLTAFLKRLDHAGVNAEKRAIAMLPIRFKLHGLS